ncbi:MAG: hypothetical protein LHW56_09190, partial [Candidatus Cloacimonetes bacterium]|nr:hypothetical protein [Candidatus Cloacimonadota bacterium]MDY0173065.1 hypothetical protein [Candidatus Cloacimonadaceae bacterium]
CAFGQTSLNTQGGSVVILGGSKLGYGWLNLNVQYGSFEDNMHNGQVNKLKLCYIPIFCDPLRKVFLANCNDPDKSGYLKGFHSNII